MAKKTQVVFLVIITVSFSRNSLGDDCDCVCRHLPNVRPYVGDVAVCDFLENLNNAVEANKGDLIKWNRHFSFVKRFSENWKEEIEAVLEEKLENKDRQNNRERDGDRRRYPKSLNRDLVEITETTESSREAVTPEERLRAVESRTFKLQRELVQEKKVRRQLEMNLATTERTLITVTQHILNLTSSMDVVMKLFYSKYPTFANALNERLNFFVEQMNAGIEKLYKRQSAMEKSYKISVKNVEEESLADENIAVFKAFASRLDNLEERVKGYDASITEILHKVNSMSCKPKQRRSWLKPRKKKVEDY